MLYKPSVGKYDDERRVGYTTKRDAIRRDYFESGIIEIQPLGFIRGRIIISTAKEIFYV